MGQVKARFHTEDSSRARWKEVALATNADMEYEADSKGLELIETLARSFNDPPIFTGEV